MSTGTALEMINNLDDELIENAMEEPAFNKNTLRFKKLRWTVAAALIALLAAVPVVAYTFNLTVTHHEESGFWSVYSEEARFALDEFSPELLKKTDELTDVIEYILFQRINQVEEFVGIELPKNKSLKSYNLNNIKMKNNAGVMMDGRYMVTFGTGTESENLIRVSVYTSYSDEKIHETVNYEFITEKMPYENAGNGWANETSSGTYTDPEKYTTPNGRECVIAEIEHKRYRHEMGEWGYVGITMVGRVNTRVEVRGFDKEEVYARLTEILDNFE